MVNSSQVEFKEKAKKKMALIIIFVDSGDSPDESSDEVLDVTIPVQCLVRDSKLVVHESSKVCLITKIVILFYTFLNCRVSFLVSLIQQSVKKNL